MNKNKVISKNKRQNKKGKKIFIIAVCAFIAAVLIFGAVLGIVLASRNARAVVKYKTVTMDGEVLSFFESYYKYQYMILLANNGVKGVEDTEEFWNTKGELGKTYGELLKEGAKEYIASVMAGNYLFNSYSSLTASDKEAIEAAAENTLDYKAGGDKKLFNSETEKYGFDYDSYKEAVKMMYKAITAQTVIYGQGGAKLDSYPELASEYLNEYTRVHLLTIRTKTEFLLDDDGNRIKDSEGNYATRPLTSEKKAEREKLIAEIRGYISAIGTGGVEMGEEMFINHYISKYDEGNAAKNHSDGYYFHVDSEYTASFSEELGSIVEKAFSMEIGEFSEVELDLGVCFIYKCEPTYGAYKMSSNESYFTDFYSNASSALYEKNLDELISEVVFTDKYDADAIVSRPYNYIYYPAF